MFNPKNDNMFGDVVALITKFLIIFQSKKSNMQDILFTTAKQLSVYSLLQQSVQPQIFLNNFCESCLEIFYLIHNGGFLKKILK